MSIKGSYHQHYLFLKQLVPALSETLKGKKLNEAFTTSKTELVLLFEGLTVKMLSKYNSGFLLFETTPYYKGSNAQPCFEDLSGLKVEEVLMHPYNRSFEVHIGGKLLVFKCYDALCNVIEVSSLGEVTDLFRDSIQSDHIYQKEQFWQNDEAMVSKLNMLPVEEGVFRLYQREDEAYYLSLSTSGDKLVEETTDPIHASSLLGRYALSLLGFRQQKLSRIATLQGEIKRILQQIRLSEQGIDRLMNESPFEEIGHIVMANLHLIQKGTGSVQLFDFYRNQSIEVKLKKDLDGAANAAYYYRKAKNKKIELAQMEQKLNAMRVRLAERELLLQQTTSATHMKQLKPLVIPDKQQEVFPFKRFTSGDFEIWVGKNAQNNDLLTQKYAHKNDLWLHAKDVSGSHTIIRHKAGKPFTQQVIQCAAEIAAYYSKHKGNTMAPVCYTLKKYVRKPKGAEPGAVVLEREEVVLVTPALPY